MYEISEDASPKEMLNFLRGATVPEIVATCVVVRKISDYAVSTSGTKEQLLHGLRGVPAKVLFEAIDSVFPSDDCEDDVEDEIDDDCEDEECDEDDCDEDE